MVLLKSLFCTACLLGSSLPLLSAEGTKSDIPSLPSSPAEASGSTEPLNSSKEHTPSLAEQMESAIQGFIQQHSFMGSVIVVQKGEPLFVKGFGYCRTPQGPANAPETTYRWDSITKIFTAVAMIQLYERKLIDLDAPITTYLTEYADAEAYPGFRGVTVRSLLAMKSGIADAPEEANWLATPPTITDIANYAAVRPRTKVGTWNYVNSGYNICALILGRVVDPSRDPSLVYQDYLKKNLFVPAQMTTAFAPATVAEDHPQAEGHIWNKEGKLQPIGTDQFPDYTSMRVGTGNINGSVWDFQKFTSALNAGKLITPKSLSMLLEQKLGGWTPLDLKVNGHPFMDKDGGQTGMRSYYMRFENDTTIFIVANQDPKGIINGVHSDAKQVQPQDHIEYLGRLLAELLYPQKS